MWMRSVTLAVEADRHLHFVQLLTNRSLNLSMVSKFSRSPPCTLSQSSYNHHSIGEPKSWWQYYQCGWRKRQDWDSACCAHTDLSKEFSLALKAITRGLAPRWVSQWVFLICQLVANFSEASWYPRHAFASSIVVPLCFSQFIYLFICLLTYYVIMAEVTFHFQFSHPPSLLGRFMNPLFGLDLLSYVGTLIFWRFR